MGLQRGPLASSGGPPLALQEGRRPLKSRSRGSSFSCWAELYNHFSNFAILWAPRRRSLVDTLAIPVPANSHVKPFMRNYSHKTVHLKFWNFFLGVFFYVLQIPYAVFALQDGRDKRGRFRGGFRGGFLGGFPRRFPRRFSRRFSGRFF